MYTDGIAAINLESPDRIPRTEYSAHFHWDLVNKILGTNVGEKSPAAEQQRASTAFTEAWDYAMFWNIYLGNQPFGDMRTDMGHAVYRQDNADFDNRIFCPFKNEDEVLAFDPVAAYGVPDPKETAKLFIDNYNEQQKLYPNTVNMIGTYVTLMSGLIDIFGWEMLLLAAGVDPDGFGKVANRYADWIMPYFEALAEAHIPVVMVHDDIVWTEGPFISKDWYRKYIFPNYKRFFAPLLEAGSKILYTSDGNYTMFVDDIAECGVNGFVMEPLTDMAYIAERYGKTHVIVGNADTRVLLNGSREDIYGEVKRCIDIGRDCPGFIMAVGNHIPANTPVENALYYNECFEKLRKR
ncbi:MAG: uroporphyrinogen decarboxylase family protein [Acutalibacteraceae bacterium]